MHSVAVKVKDCVCFITSLYDSVLFRCRGTKNVRHRLVGLRASTSHYPVTKLLIRSQTCWSNFKTINQICQTYCTWTYFFKKWQEMTILFYFCKCKHKFAIDLHIWLMKISTSSIARFAKILNFLALGQGLALCSDNLMSL